MAATFSSAGARSSKCVSTGTETSGQLTATAGALLDGVGGFSVHVQADSGQTITAAGTLQAYLYQDVDAIWSRATDLDLTPATGVRGVGFLGFSVPSPRGRIAYLPSGMTVSSGSVTLYILTTSRADGTGGAFAN